MLSIPTDTGYAPVNAFSAPGYLSCVAEAYYPGRDFELADYAVAGSTYRLLHILPRGLLPRKVVTWVPTLDLLEPVSAEGRPGPSYLPLAYQGTDSAAAWRDRGATGDIQVSPLIDLGRFPAWEDFVAYARRQPGGAFRSARARQARKLEAEHGLVTSWNDETPGVLETLLAWKSLQYRRSGFIDGFQSPSLVRLFTLLRAGGHLVISTLRVGGVLVAGHLGMVHGGRFYYWVPAYDPAWGKEAVGAILLEWMMEESHRRGLREFDFLLGNEAYKWSYATHTRLVGPVGTKPLSAQLWGPLRARLMDTVRQYPGAYRCLQASKRKVSGWSLQLRG